VGGSADFPEFCGGGHSHPQWPCLLPSL
jgi:hypothetical protein